MKNGARFKGLGSPQDVQEALSQALYIASEDLATAIYLAMVLGKPLLLEGAPGVGKTEAAKALSATLSCELIRLQCYEGIDANTALYEWNFPRQILAMRQADDAKLNIYDSEFLIARPLLQALHLQSEGLLLIDEIDRADHEFEALLLEFLSDFQITIPERGRVCASQRPFVILTSNRTRDLHEALRRRCVYHWIDYPSPSLEVDIVMSRASNVAKATAEAIVAAVGRLRAEPLAKAPGVAETVEWADAATCLNDLGETWPEAFRRSIGVVLKEQDDLSFLEPRMREIIG
ncbi:AAA domain-containing protein [Rhodobacteraceae bacterium Araon29]